jgi:hypothetical protein
LFKFNSFIIYLYAGGSFMNKAEKIHCNKVALLGCYICGAEPQLHHIRNDGTGNVGIGRRNSHFSVIPLCYNHHLGSFSIHNRKLDFEKRHGTEKEILQIITERLYGQKEL